MTLGLISIAFVDYSIFMKLKYVLNLL